MQVDSTSSINILNSIYTKESTQKSNSFDSHLELRTISALSKDYTSIENLKPSDISFEDYNKLNYEALEYLFKGDSEKIADSSSLMGYSQLTDDKVLNKIYFDKQLESKKNGNQNDYFDTLQVISIMKFPTDILEPHFHFSTLSQKDKALFSSFNNQESISSKEKPLFSNADSLFDDFGSFKQYYEKTKVNWSENMNINKVFENMSEIQSLYNQRKEENSAILNSYIR